ncbi:MAG: winged helix-turn-helix domain-containing protein [Acidobacteriota bacterium]|nr:winged helix-turn-helix domain-containing protein [Acidobacteriota bacterium]
MKGSEPTYQFGPYQIDSEQVVLLREGILLAVPPKLVETLLALVEAQGRVVTKEQLMARLWPDSFVEESNLARNVYLLRKALGKRPEGGEYIETVSRRGYRFAGNVHIPASGNGAAASPASTEQTRLASKGPKAGSGRAARRTGIVIPIVAILAIGLFVFFRGTRQAPRLLQQAPITFNSSLMPVTSAVLSPSGQYLAYTDAAGIHVRNIDARTESSLPAPPGASDATIEDWFPDHSSVLVVASRSGQRGLWRIPVIGRGDPELICMDVNSAAISPDGARIAATTGDQRTILLMAWNGGSPAPLARAPAGNKFVDLSWVPGADQLETIRQPSNVYDSMIEVIDIRTRQVRQIDPRGRATSLDALPGGRTIYSKIGPPPFSYTNLWLITTGRAAPDPRQVTDWAATSISSLSSSAGGRCIALIKAQDNKFIATGDLTDHQTKLLNVRRVTADDRNDYPHDWTPDSRGLLFESDRAGPWKIYEKILGQPEAQAIASESGDENYPRMSPDGHWVLWVRSTSVWSLRQSATLMRAAFERGKPEEVAQITGFNGFRCARGAGKGCVVSLARSGELTFRRLDPAAGVGGVILTMRLAPAESFDWDLSPGGDRIALVDGHSAFIRVIGLRGGARETVRVNGQPRLQSIAWRADGKGWFIGAAEANGAALLAVDPGGGAHVLWQGPNNFVPYGVPSPDGRHLAFPEYSAVDRVWMLENY